MKNLDAGFLYSVFSKDFKTNKFYKEFLVSLSSLKSVLPNCSVSLYTNLPIEPDDIDVIYDPEMPRSQIAKAYGLLKSPYKKTIYLDSDTLVHRNILNDVFSVLDEFDFTCCYGNGWNRGEIFPDLNTGLLGVHKNKFTQESIHQWIKIFESNKKIKSDQKSFREIFINNKRKFHILPWWFQNRLDHFTGYKENIVITHAHNMNKSLTIQRIKDYL